MSLRAKNISGSVLRGLVLGVVLSVVAVVGCFVLFLPEMRRTVEEDKMPMLTASVKTHPHLTDRLHALLRQQLRDSEPVLLEQASVCERSRLRTIVGADETSSRVQGVLDTVYQAPEDRARRETIRTKTSGMGLSPQFSVCDSLNALIITETPTGGRAPDSLTPAERELLRRLHAPPPR
jgi:hypothetical protein